MVHLGQIVVAAGASKNNLTTAAQFAINGYPSIAVLIKAADASVELVSDSAGTATTTATNGVPLSVNQVLPIPIMGNAGDRICTYPILAVFSTAGCTVDVWGLWS